MATEVGSAVVSIIPSAKGFQRALQTQIGPQVSGFGKSSGTEMGKQSKTGFLGAFKGIAAPLAGIFAVSKGVEFFKGAISEASNLEESLNALKVTYGENADAVAEMGRTANETMGLSNVEFNNLAVQFSAFSETIAGKGGDVVGTLEDLATRGADFASVMNLEVADAMALFQSGLAGETEPLRKYGIDLSAAAVEQYALANGIIETGETMTEQQKVQARYGALMDQTKKTTGDFANTADSAANAQRRLGASWDNIKAKVGAVFLPALASATDGLANFFSDMTGAGKKSKPEWLEEVGAALGDFNDEMNRLKSENAGLFDFLGEAMGANVMPAIGEMLEWWIAEVEMKVELFTGIVKGIGNASLLAGEVATKAFAMMVEGISGSVSSFLRLTADLLDTLPGMGGMADKMRDAATSVDAVGDGLGAKARGWAKDFEFARERINWTAEEAAKLSNRISLLPEKAQVLIETPGAGDTVEEVIRYQKMLELTPDEVVTFIQAKGTKLSEADVTKLNRKYDLTPEQVVTIMRAGGVKATEKDIGRLKRQYELTPEQVTTLLKASGGKFTQKEVRALQRVYDLTPKEITTALKQTGKDFTEKQVKDLQRRYNLTPKQVDTLIRANDQATPVINRVSSEGARLDGKVFTTTFRTIEEKVTRQLGAIGVATGGYITGPGTATSDSIPAYLSNGEFVVKAAAVDRYGTNLLHNINAMRFADGGYVSKTNRYGDVAGMRPHNITPARFELVLDDGTRLTGKMRDVSREEIDDDYEYRRRVG